MDTILIAHAEGEAAVAEQLAVPRREAGYDVAYEGTVLVGESVVENASNILAQGGPVVLCGTVRAIGTPWAKRVVNAARRHEGVKIFVVQIEEDADVDAVTFGEKVAQYWKDPAVAMSELLAAVQTSYPTAGSSSPLSLDLDVAGRRYRETVKREHQWVRLNVIAGPRQDRVTQIPLMEVFVPQLAEARLPTYDVPDEVLASRRQAFDPSGIESGLDDAELDSEDSGGTEFFLDDTDGTSNALLLPESVFGLVGRERAQVILGGPELARSIKICRKGGGNYTNELRVFFLTIGMSKGSGFAKKLCCRCRLRSGWGKSRR